MAGRAQHGEGEGGWPGARCKKMVAPREGRRRGGEGSGVDSLA